MYAVTYFVHKNLHFINQKHHDFIFVVGRYFEVDKYHYGTIATEPKTESIINKIIF